MDRTVLWWGRFDADYPRNRILRAAMREAGWQIVDFRPLVSALGDVETVLRGVASPDLVWVPCFRQRDMAAAARFARRRGAPLVFDPLISAWDKQIFERKKFAADSGRGQALLQWERRLFRLADLLIADTPAHAAFFAETFGLPDERLAIIPVGAEEALFRPAPLAPVDDRPVEVLFFGSFIDLQGPQWIVEAARQCADKTIRWVLLGSGPLREECRRRAAGMENVSFEDWLPYSELPARIHRADILLGVFGASEKADRVIPNKAYQALTCGRPLITRAANAWPEDIAVRTSSGIAFVPPADPAALAAAVTEWAAEPGALPALADAAAKTYREHLRCDRINEALNAALGQVVDKFRTES